MGLSGGTSLAYVSSYEKKGFALDLSVPDKRDVWNASSFVNNEILKKE